VPQVDLVNVIGTLVDGRNNITIPGFADNIHQHREDLEIWSNLEMAGEFNLDRYKEHLGVPALKEQRSIGDLLYERWCIPSLSIVDIRAGDIANEEGGQQNEGCYRFGPTRFSVIPHCAAGKISIRFVPKQSHEHLVECAKVG
jgi:di- and tripeptidase/Cys-Gly metallodipeptidase DUG1